MIDTETGISRWALALFWLFLSSCRCDSACDELASQQPCEWQSLPSTQASIAIRICNETVLVLETQSSGRHVFRVRFVGPTVFILPLTACNSLYFAAIPFRATQDSYHVTVTLLYEDFSFSNPNLTLLFLPVASFILQAAALPKEHEPSVDTRKPCSHFSGVKGSWVRMPGADLSFLHSQRASNHSLFLHFNDKVLQWWPAHCRLMTKSELQR